MNSINHAGSTALMWATRDATKVQLLLARHAKVNAGSKDGATPLYSAAFRGNIEVIRMLLAAGAEPGAELAWWPGGPKIGLLPLAYGTNDAGVREVLAREGVNVQVPAALGNSPLTRLLLTITFSGRRQPEPTNAGVVNALLDLGASPNEVIPQLALSVPALSRMALLGDVETMRLLIERGADPKLPISSQKRCWRQGDGGSYDRSIAD